MKPNRKNKSRLIPKGVKKQLKTAYSLCGYMRIPKMKYGKRLKQINFKIYKKGWETRFVVNNEDALEKIRKLLNYAGFKAGKPYEKHSQFVQPVYGKKFIDWLFRRG